jgi:hypothetical protein
VKVTNAGPFPAQAVSVTDDLPANLSLVAVTSDGGFTCGTGDPFICTLPTLPVGSATLTFDARVSPTAPPGIVTNTVTVSASNHEPSPQNNDGSAATSVLARPSLTTHASAGGRPPVSLTDLATLSGGLNPTGTITFRVFGPDDTTCSRLAAATFTATVAGNGDYPSGSFTATAPGVYRWTADLRRRQQRSGLIAVQRAERDGHRNEGHPVPGYAGEPGRFNHRREPVGHPHRHRHLDGGLRPHRHVDLPPLRPRRRHLRPSLRLHRH